MSGLLEGNMSWSLAMTNRSRQDADFCRFFYTLVRPFMFGVMQLIGSLFLTLALYGWPVFAFLIFAMVMFEGKWSVVHYLLIASFLAHNPLARYVRNKIIREGEFSGDIDKLKMTAPILINMALFIGLYISLFFRRAL